MMDTDELQETDGLVVELKELNGALARRQQAAGSAAMRRSLAQQIGRITQLHYLCPEEIRALLGDSPLVGVDGSFGSCGASFPYLVTFFRALARSTRQGVAGNKYWTDKIFSPLLSKDQARVQGLLDQGLNPEDALAHIRWETLAAMEAEAGEAALERERPRILLWDGGFARLATHAPAIWERIKAGVLRQGTIMLGVAEEIATRTLVKQMSETGDTPAEAFAGWADREQLYGMLQPGEIFRVHGHLDAPCRWGRIYARLSRHPQAIAVDYLAEQAGDLEAAMNFLYTVTPAHGRGFPLWLDVVDAEVRITADQVEALLAAYLDPALRELFLRPLRARPTYNGRGDGSRAHA